MIFSSFFIEKIIYPGGEEITISRTSNLVTIQQDYSTNDIEKIEIDTSVTTEKHLKLLRTSDGGTNWTTLAECRYTHGSGTYRPIKTIEYGYTSESTWVCDEKIFFRCAVNGYLRYLLTPEDCKNAEDDSVTLDDYTSSDTLDDYASHYFAYGR